jgi:hypothetical protein
MNRLYVVYNPDFDHLAAITRMKQLRLLAQPDIEPILVSPVTTGNAKCIMLLLVRLLVNGKLSDPSSAAVLGAIQYVTSRQQESGQIKHNPYLAVNSTKKWTLQ